MEKKSRVAITIINFAFAVFLSALPFVLEDLGMRISLLAWCLLEALAGLTIIVTLIWLHRRQIRNIWRTVCVEIREHLRLARLTLKTGKLHHRVSASITLRWNVKKRTVDDVYAEVECLKAEIEHLKMELSQLKNNKLQENQNIDKKDATD